ncbi:family 69 glycosyltransferase [Microthyrium microscopicum]|uniref:Family 69 glycosyltransferase n=1 Tax=Microthyrium microscopicum TaxID=703497 RepID=A0A6A6UJN1_9PEZI|nr:family 69 glycosyltransferase [Microthyrium microscopicum]
MPRTLHRRSRSLAAAVSLLFVGVFLLQNHFGHERRSTRSATLLAAAPPYIEAILNPEDTQFPRLDCSLGNANRYSYLASDNHSVDGKLKYFFALDLYEAAHILPRLIGSVVEAIIFLGPSNCAVSIVEGRSTDGTFEILFLLGDELQNMGIEYFLQRSNLDPHGDRIGTLATLRNMALEPLMAHKQRFSSDTTVVFLNDVAICAEDILELIHQRVFQGADMTCPMDWTYVGPDPTFYDIWIARGITGDTFFNAPEDGDYNLAWDLFWNDEPAKSKLSKHQPFQVFSCWNGGVAFTAQPVLEEKIRFRHHSEEECFQGEPKLFCKDMWHYGFGKIAVVPSINLEYSDEQAKKIKELKGYTSKWTKDVNSDDKRIDWKQDPPELVQCMPSAASQDWVPWDEGNPWSSPSVL